MSPRILLLIITLGAAIFARGQTPTKMLELKIAGGQTVKCPASDRGPLPAQSGPYKMEVAGMMLNTDDNGMNLSLIFTFGLKIATQTHPSHILIEDVSDASPVTMVDDKAPELKASYWKGNASPLKVSKASTPWIFDSKPTTKVFKITISVRGAQDVILYQPSWYAVSSKAKIVEFGKVTG